MAEDSKQIDSGSTHFSAADLIAIREHGPAIADIERHLRIHRDGIAKYELDRPASVADGIVKFTNEETQRLCRFYIDKRHDYTVQKFVPASGAASRMFKFLTAFVNEYDPETESFNAYIIRRKATDLTVFLTGIEKFPFFEAVRQKLYADFADFATWPKNLKNLQFIKTMLSDPDFDFVNKPKAVLPFHKYSDHIATPIEEHLYEATSYAVSKDVAKIHFTVSDSHQILFEKIVSDKRGTIEADSQIAFEIEYSWQDPATDTIAVDSSGKPFRDHNGELFFRPAGHGALLSNLNQLDADLVFITNIDNVVQDHLETIGKYKMALAGKLLDLQIKTFDYLRVIDTTAVLTSEKIAEIADFLQQNLNVRLSDNFDTLEISKQIAQLFGLLNRPIRVCGMVKNEGEPGGGPFWVRHTNNKVSLQIVESSQVDLQNPEQAKILQQSTHFNPVDLVCGITDYRGNKFDLHQFTDPESGFIVSKSKDGSDYFAYEMPGLWNGAMANWITVFVEVPLITFNPVKTVNDLLKPTHQPQ